MRAQNANEQVIAIIEGFVIFVVGGMFSALIPVCAAMIYHFFAENFDDLK